MNITFIQTKLYSYNFSETFKNYIEKTKNTILFSKLIKEPDIFYNISKYLSEISLENFCLVNKNIQEAKNQLKNNYPNYYKILQKYNLDNTYRDCSKSIVLYALNFFANATVLSTDDLLNAEVFIKNIIKNNGLDKLLIAEIEQIFYNCTLNKNYSLMYAILNSKKFIKNRAKFLATIILKYSELTKIDNYLPDRLFWIGSNYFFYYGILNMVESFNMLNELDNEIFLLLNNQKEEVKNTLKKELYSEYCENIETYRHEIRFLFMLNEETYAKKVKLGLINSELIN